MVRKIDVDASSILLEFIHPIYVGGIACMFAIAHTRLERDNLETLLEKGTLGCGITCVPPERYNPERPFDLAWWRGGGAAIAELIL